MKQSTNKSIQSKVNKVIEQIDVFKQKMDRIEREAEEKFQRESDALEKRHRDAAGELRRLKVWQEELHTQKENTRGSEQWGRMRTAINSVQNRFI